MTKTSLGISGRIAAFFQTAQITPLLALPALLLGGFAVLVTPREEEPQINVTMANVLIPFPGAAVRDVEQMVASPAEQVLSQIAGVEHVMSVSSPGLAVVTVQFKVGVPRTEALVRVYDTVNSNADWLPAGLGVLAPIIKPKGIDDVPIVTLTLFSTDATQGAFGLERVAHSIEADLKRVPGTREVRTIGGPGRAIRVELDPARMAGSDVTVTDLRAALQSASLGLPLGELLAGNRAVALESGPFLKDAREVGELVVAVRAGKPVFLQDMATVVDGPLPAARYVWHGSTGPGAAEAQLLIVGRKAWKAGPILDAYQQMRHGSAVHFTGRVADDELAGLYAAALATVYVPYFEGFGIPIVEAQASGCPVLTSSVSSMPEVAGPGGALLADPFDVASIAAGLARLWHEPALRQQLVARGHANLGRFSWARSAGVLWQALEKAMGEG